MNSSKGSETIYNGGIKNISIVFHKNNQEVDYFQNLIEKNILWVI